MEHSAHAARSARTWVSLAWGVLRTGTQIRAPPNSAIIFSADSQPTSSTSVRSSDFFTVKGNNRLAFWVRTAPAGCVYRMLILWCLFVLCFEQGLTAFPVLC